MTLITSCSLLVAAAVAVNAATPYYPSSYCLVDTMHYAPGQSYAPPGSVCPTPTCVCDPNGSGSPICHQCPSTQNTISSATVGRCNYNDVYFKAGSYFNQKGLACAKATCRCDPNGTGVVTCTACRQLIAGACVVGSSSYYPGAVYKPAGSTCSEPTCTCSSDGSGRGVCKSCPTTTGSSGYSSMCLVDNRYYYPGERYNPSSVTCSTLICMCSTAGTGLTTCTSCPTTSYTNPTYCYDGNKSYQPGQKYVPSGSACPNTATCTCDSYGSGQPRCVMCPGMF